MPASPHFLSRTILRAAFDIGASHITVTVGAIDTKAKTLQRVHYHTSVPCQVEMLGDTITSQGQALLRNTMEQLAGRMSLLPQAPSEAAGVVTGPLAAAVNLEDVLTPLAQEFFINFVRTTSENLEEFSHNAYTVAGGISVNHRDNVFVWSEVNDEVQIIQRKRDDIKVYTVPVSVEDVFQTMLKEYQKRSESAQSVNPVLVSEAKAVLQDLEQAIEKDAPAWLRGKVADRDFVGASGNGGTLNVAARAVGRVFVSISKLRQATYLSYCGATDAWLARSFPEPHLVVPRLLITLAILHGVGVRCVQYLPEISVTHGMLMEPSLWAEGRRAELEQQFQSAPWETAPRHFTKPWQSRGQGYPNVDPRIAVHKRHYNYRPISRLLDY